MTKEEKMIQIMKLYADVMDNDLLVSKFFDLESEEMLDLKIKVLTQLKNGISPKDIPEYYSILERYPENNDIWD